MAVGRGFPRSARLLKRADFLAVMRSGDSSHDSYFTVFGVSGPRAKGRLGITVSRRAASKAVHRNRLKRCVRESFRHHRNALRGIDVVVIARPAAARAEVRRLTEALRAHWKKILDSCGYC